jgi:hypothetical protein
LLEIFTHFNGVFHGTRTRLIKQKECCKPGEDVGERRVGNSRKAEEGKDGENGRYLNAWS